ncbi:peroxiredoxin [Dictyobacter arantiisoli]|uniref:thioredoxin-dependent peroxiredoxin n=1 Tax=Dictyobacter arantiisoli TaxID=2014874 RepID=A0A5A5TD56_9CHLR|nr:peroxiredoxin [Dictyobacter arantiisoli]GCF09461.1 peroxiredoxin [Dictyobacter arantiisoli]
MASPTAAKINVGDKAPDFTLSTQTGTSVSLKDYLGEKAIVLYFYPKDDTPGCTTEACAFRDSYEVFKHAGAEVLGISSDSVAAHQKFSTKYHLPFILLSDPRGVARKLFGVPPTFGLLPGRVTYVIDKEGIVRHIFSSQFAVEKHIEEALNTLKAAK